MDVDAILCLFVCADVGPHGCEVDLMRASPCQGPVRPPREEPWEGERHRCEDVEARPSDDEQLGDVILITLVSGNHMLLRWRPRNILRIFIAAWRRCYRECLRACGLTSRMRVS
jgi:hypothetical protein